MPFKSEKQRRLLWAARKSAKLRKKLGMSEATAKKMTDHDEGGHLPPHSEHLKKVMKRR